MLLGEFLHVPGAVIVLFMQIFIWRSGNDKRIESYPLLMAALLYGLGQIRQALVKAGFLIMQVSPGMKQPMRFDKDQPLVFIVYHPQDEVRVKTAFLEEAHTFAPA